VGIDRSIRSRFVVPNHISERIQALARETYQPVLK
jgi:hypothetical protein